MIHFCASNLSPAHGACSLSIRRIADGTEQAQPVSKGPRAQRACEQMMDPRESNQALSTWGAVRVDPPAESLAFGALRGGAFGEVRVPNAVVARRAVVLVVALLHKGGVAVVPQAEDPLSA